MMVHATRSKYVLIILLCFCINISVADPWRIHVHRRDGTTTSSITATDASTTQSVNTATQTSSSGGASFTDHLASATTITTSALNSTSVSSSGSASSTSTSATATAIISNLNGASPTSILNHSGFNSTLTPNELPITPTTTPGFGVAGVILMLSGIVYTLVGIKNKFLHISISAAYLSSLAVTVLIIYVMNPPISNGIQGAYVVAIVITGFVLGGASIVVTELTEGLGCLFGGFCLSMWLLCLKPGGLLTATSSRAILIAILTIAIFSTSFSHYTRPYGLIASISFGGATALVMGIDCFSRAGLKEFWAYLWDLNDNLFPLGATTYPLTRGIKVEIAAIVIIFLAGIISQMKLWKIIKESRKQRAIKRLQDEQTIAQEEENVGKRIEHANAQERDQWEAVYGDKDAVKSTGPSNRDSGVGDMDSQKKGPTSTVASLRRSGEDEIELADMPSPTFTTGAGLVMTNQGQDGNSVTVRVARDLESTPELNENGDSAVIDPKRSSNISQPQQDDEKIWVVGIDGEARLERRLSQQNSSRVSLPPEVIPLPFKIPQGGDDDNQSSVATFADEEQAGPRRGSRHLSAGIDVVRKLSHKSHRSSQRYSTGEGESVEDLVIPTRADIENDRASSIAATMDGLSDDGDMKSVRSSIVAAPDTTEAARIPEITTTAPTSEPSSRSVAVPTGNSSETNRISAETVATTILDPESYKEEKVGDGAETSNEPITQRSLTSSTDPKPEAEGDVKENAPTETGKGENTEPSVVSAVESKPTSITKDRLPAQLSKVVMSYRTNEWAKHLSQADAPEVEDLKLAEYAVEAQPAVTEKPAPVNVEELQQTATSAAPTSIQRTASQMSNYSSAPPPRSVPNELSIPSASPKPDITNSQDAGPIRSASQQSQNRGAGFRFTLGPKIPQPIVESPIEDHFPSTAPAFTTANKFGPAKVPYGTSTTLMGRRDSMLRSKQPYYSSQSSLPTTPEMPSQLTSQYNSPNASRGGSDAGSIYNHSNISTPVMDDDNMSLSARRNLIRQSSLHNTSPLAKPLQQTPVPFDAHLPQRQSSAPSAVSRDQQLASWRASVQNDLQNSAIPQNSLERQRSTLWQERQAEDQRRALEERMRLTRDVAFDEMMRRGDMLDAHRQALRKMQASANRHA